jgi:hypothetical protein
VLVTTGRLTAAAHAGLWSAVDELVDRAPRLSDLRGHGLHLLAVRRWQALGRPVPDELATEQRASAFLSLVGLHVLEQARDACTDPIVVMKGPELAARYPDPALRPFRDLDLLAADALRTQRELIAACFEPIGVPGRYAGIHHLQPLRRPDLPLIVEVHDRPKWVEGLPAPRTEELLEVAVPSACGAEGVLALSPQHHALAVAAHSWSHVPLGRLLHLVDIAALLPEIDAEATAALARRWGLDRVWRTTLAATEAVLPGTGVRGALPPWAGNLREARERTVLETHLERWFSAFSAFPRADACGRSARAVGRALGPRSGESGANKLRRTRRAARDAFSRQSDHHRALDRQGIGFGPRIGEE